MIDKDILSLLRPPFKHILPAGASILKIGAKINLPLSGVFYEKDVLYDYDDYALHLRQTLDFEAAHPNYSLLQTEENAFCNLQIIMNLGHWAMVSKEKSPAIHFVIHHPKLRGAIEKFSPPIVEK